MNPSILTVRVGNSLPAIRYLTRADRARAASLIGRAQERPLTLCESSDVTRLVIKASYRALTGKTLRS
jgi:hypothetical protein